MQEISPRKETQQGAGIWNSCSSTSSSEREPERSNQGTVKQKSACPRGPGRLAVILTLRSKKEAWEIPDEIHMILHTPRS